MKFASDYRGLKKRITAIRKAEQGLQLSPSSSQENLNLGASRASDGSEQDNQSVLGQRRGSVGSHQSGAPRRRNSHIVLASPISEKNEPPRVVLAAGSDEASSGTHTTQAPRGSANSRGRRPSLVQRMSMGAAMRRGARSFSRQMSISQPPHPLVSLPLRDLLYHLSPVELAFFSYLDGQYDKIESFYLDREKEMAARTKLLRDQLNELRDHRKLFHQAQSANPAWPILENINIRLRSKLPKNASQGIISVDPPGLDDGKAEAGLPRQSQIESHRRSSSTYLDHPIHENTLMRITSGLKSMASSIIHVPGDPDDNRGEGVNSGAATPRPEARKRSLDPDDYLYAKKKLKKAVVEHYRGLEVLHNYRDIPAQKQYMSEKVEQGALASDKTVRAMMKEMEEMFSEIFVRGDKKRAMTRLRGGSHIKSHHYSTFRSGIFLGLALPAFVSGVYEVLHESAREEIPGWDGLLFIYGALLIPALFSMINYVFIFGASCQTRLEQWLMLGFNSELDVRTRLDHREYFETPSILLAGLCYAFWLSFLRLGAPAVSPSIWPLVWLGPSRYWLAKRVGKLFISGTRRVEGGKYGSGIIANLFYFIWRHQGNTHGVILVFWCLFNTIYSVYASSWDILMDWSLLRPHSNYTLLRTELVYSNHILLYYFAMISNVLIRFIWVIYIPKSGPNIMVRTFIGGILEVLRRWQWNFYRLENEHIGNMDQYRATREVPLPYSFEDAAQEDDADDEGEIRPIEGR
ncbi:EXS family-domain-containing protein [Infundibulicybe gibba]|nr:EXS family-domain-containing protein [Infundibulicybe gibba]